MRMGSWGVVCSGVLVIATGCAPRSTGGTQQACTPGAQQSCPCAGAMDGVQQCNADGTGFNACQGCTNPVGSSSHSAQLSSSSSGPASTSGAASGSTSAHPPLPAPTVTPPSGATLGPNTVVRVFYTQTLVTAATTLGGTLATAPWTLGTTALTQDTIEIRAPLTGWPQEGPGSLVVDTQAVDGRVPPTTFLAYEVDLHAPGFGFVPSPGSLLSAVQPVSIQFSEAVDPASVQVGGDLGQAAVQPCGWANARTCVLTPTTLWPQGTHKTLTFQASDLVGNRFPMEQTFYDVDATPPVVTVTPTNGAVIRSVADVVVTFDEPVDVQSLVMTGGLTNGASPVFHDGRRLTFEVGVTMGPLVDGTLDFTITDIAGNSTLTHTSFVVDPEPLRLLESQPVDHVLRSATATAVMVFNRSVVNAAVMATGTLFGAGSHPSPMYFTNTFQDGDTLVMTPPADGWRGDGDLNITVTDGRGNVNGPIHYQGRIAVAADLPTILLPVHGVRVSDDNGTRTAGITLQEATTWLAEANRVYADANIQFQLDANANSDLSSLSSTLVNQMAGDADPQWTAEVNAGNAEAALHPGAMTVFFRYGPPPGPTGGAFSSTQYNFVAATGFSATSVCGHQNITLLAHEIGHYLGLRHTFAGAYNTVAEAAAAYAGDPNVFDGDAVVDTAPDPFIAALQCTQDAFVTLGAGTLQVGRHNIMSYYDSFEKHLSATQAMRVRQAAIARAGLDVRMVTAGTFLPAVEGETVTGIISPQAYAGPQTNMAAFVGKWSHDAQLYWAGAPQGTMSFNLPVPTAGVYRLLAVFTEAPEFGIHAVSINGRVMTVVNLYGGAVAHTPPVELGTTALGVNNTFTLTNSGKDNRSGGFGAGIDYILVEAVP